MPIAPHFTSIYEQSFEIGFQNCYPNGYLKYTEIISLFQVVYGVHADIGGISYLDLQKHHQAWVLSKMKIEVTKLPKWRDVVTIKTWIKSLENSRSIRCLEMYLNNEKIVGCETFWVAINTQTRRPEQMVLSHDHFEIHPIDAINQPFTKLQLPTEINKIKQKKIELSDLDIINHANNVKYMEWCLDAIDSKIVLSKSIKSLELNYIRELNLNDEITIGFTDNTFTLTKNEAICFIMKIDF